jgi:hypothetical protein
VHLQGRFHVSSVSTCLVACGHNTKGASIKGASIKVVCIASCRMLLNLCGSQLCRMGNEGRVAKGKGKEVPPSTQDKVVGGEDDQHVGGTFVGMLLQAKTTLFSMEL